MPEMIECHNLTKRFGSFTAVDHVTFSVARGSIFGFLGPNGSGKSTVIRMLCGILEPTEGTASIGGPHICRARAALKKKIGYLSPKVSPYHQVTARGYLNLFCKLYSF